MAVVYISHRLEEIREIGDRITVLKDGASVAVDLRTPSRLRPATLIRLMTGRSIEYVFGARQDRPDVAGEPVLRVRGLACGRLFAT